MIYIAHCKKTGTRTQPFQKNRNTDKIQYHMVGTAQYSFVKSSIGFACGRKTNHYRIKLASLDDVPYRSPHF